MGKMLEFIVFFRKIQKILFDLKIEQKFHVLS